MSKKSIGILAYYWPPAGGSGVQRWLRFSNHLCDLGWDVHVFTFKHTKYPILNNSNVEKINPLIKVNKIKGFVYLSEDIEKILGLKTIQEFSIKDFESAKENLKLLSNNSDVIKENDGLTTHGIQRFRARVFDS